MFFALAWLGPVVQGFAHVQIGSVVEDVEMPTLDGRKHRLLGDAAANVFIFFKPGQEHSRATMKQIASVEREMNGKSVHWVAIVSDQVSTADIEAAVKEAGIAMPVLIDAGDALRGKLGVALHPVIGFAGKDHQLVAYQPFTKINYLEVIRARIRHLLKEIDDPELEKALKPPVAGDHDAAAAARRRLVFAEKLFQARKLDQAIESARESLAKDPTLVAAHVLLGNILVAQGNRAEAVKSFEQALKLDPANADALGGKKACEGKGNDVTGPSKPARPE